MKVLPFTIPKPTNDALIYQEDHEWVFYNQLHQHAEIQLSYIVHGSGTLIVGDTVGSYSSGDILVIGAQLPHVFKSESSIEKSFMLSLFFTKESFGANFFNLEEMQATRAFFNRALRGFKVSEHGLHEQLLSLKSQGSFDRFINFLKILEQLARYTSTALSTFVHKPYSDLEGQRMSAVTNYTMTNYTQSITLTEIASVANLTPNAFCKYFKKRTRKSYFTFLNELRIARACKLLRTSPDLSISEIAELAGFKNLSNFNRQFKRLKSMTPFTYKSSF